MDSYFEGNRYVKELSPDDFDDKILYKLNENSNGVRGTCFVLFYAPWCPHCKAVKDDYINFAKTAGFIDVYAVDCEKHKEYISKIKEDVPELIKGYPTIVIYNNFLPSEHYENERSTEKFIEKASDVCLSGDCRD